MTYFPRLKIGSCLMRRLDDVYFQIIQIEKNHYLIEKIVKSSENNEDKPQFWIRRHSHELSKYEVIETLPEEYLPF